MLNALAAALSPGKGLTPSTHRLRRGLPGYLILFATHAFALQRQYLSKWILAEKYATEEELVAIEQQAKKRVNEGKKKA